MRRQIVVVVTGIAGAVLTGFALNTPGTGVRFFTLTFALAATWIVGALASGPVRLGRWGDRRDVVRPTLVAVLAFLVFLMGDLLVRHVPVLHHQVQHIIGHARGSAAVLAIVVAVLNGVGEELYFRGAVFAALEKHRPVLWSTITYLAVIACAGTPILLVAGLVLGPLLALERRLTDGILAPATTHVVWSLLIIGLLPR